MPNWPSLQLEKRIDSLAADAAVWIEKHPELKRIMALLVSIKGIAQTSAIALMGELLLLPPGLSHREWVKFAGLDPKAFDSGKSVHKKTRMSKARQPPHPFSPVYASPERQTT